MKLTFLFVILSIVDIHNICAYPNYNQLTTINLVKRTDVATNGTNPIDTAKLMRQSVENKYSNYKNLKTNSNATSSNISGVASSNNGTSSNLTTTSNKTNKPTSDNSYSNNMGGQGTVYIKDTLQDQVYYTEIIVGDQKFSVFLDTGSSILWIPNKDCTSPACQIHNRFDSSKSSTFKSEGNKWSVKYGTGSTSGVTGIDNVRIGSFTAKQQIFGLANTVSDNFIELESDGLLGLSFEILNYMDNGAPTLITNLINQKKINPIFSFHFQHYYDFDDQGTFTLGGVDKSKFKGEITFNPVIPLPDYNIMAFWLINLDDASVDDSPLSFSGKCALIDTGTTVMYLPPDDAKAIHDKIPESKLDSQNGVYIIPCDTTSVVSLKFGGVYYKIPARDLIYLPISGTQCISSITPVQFFSPDLWLVGLTFIKNVYSVFDVKNLKVGFAHSK
ncbi:7402_t:CDS:1 [Gigaspora margarita]|uniref:7402_t:CDS:1 n=1 Tax=Gigaspora margarita TaxID=4874 RepID=A0ABN7W5D5_GIGMA|nr:7402_t:CDS:1 [Gigaspora margarita]